MHALVDGLPGWLTPDQAEVLFDAARAVDPGGTVVEIGSHHGKSTVTLGTGARPGVRVVAIDPFPSDWRYGEPDTEQSLRANLATAGLTDRVDVRVTTSAAARSAWVEPVDVVYIDGAHDVKSTREDLRWAALLRPGGVLLVHDCFSSIGVTLAVLSSLLWSREVRYVGRTGSLARFERDRPSVSDRARIVSELPWWLRNVGIKVALRLRLRPLAHAVGHHDEFDPY